MAEGIGGGVGQPVEEARWASLQPYVVCALVVAVLVVRTWLMNNGIFPTTTVAYPLAREFQTAMGVFVGLAVFSLARRKPVLLKPAPVLAAMVCCAILGSILLLAFPTSPFCVTVGCCMHSCVASWGFVTLGAVMGMRGSQRVLAISVAAGEIVGVATSGLLRSPDYRASVCVCGLILLLVVLVTQRMAEPRLNAISVAPPVRDQAVVNPRSFLSSTNQLFVLIFLISAASGLALSLNIEGATPLSNPVKIVILVTVLAWFILSPEAARRNDALLTMTLILAVAGFLAMPLEDVLGSGVANALLRASGETFTVLQWTALAALCSRNPSATLAVLGLARAASSAGTFIGADAGHALNMFVLTTPQVIGVVSAVVVLSVFVYALLALKSFSYEKTFEGVVPSVSVEPIDEPQKEAPGVVAGTGRRATRDVLLANVSRTAAVYGLTAREKEVLELLAHGYGSTRIQKELTLSYNTVKTHVKHVYGKLDVHSQQELIELVEGIRG